MTGSLTTSSSTENLREEKQESSVSLIALNKLFLCFDLDSEGDATQQFEIRRIVDGEVAWRMRTNAPTRYIVNPNAGFLSNLNPTAKVKIQLVDNNFHPNHELLLQAIQIDDSDSKKDIWKSERAKIFNQIQTVYLELSTTIVNFENLQSDIKTQENALTKMLLREGMSPARQVRELREMLRMLETDCEAINNNMIKASRLKDVLHKNLFEKQTRVKSLKKEYEEMDHNLADLKQKMADAPTCTIS